MFISLVVFFALKIVVMILLFSLYLFLVVLPLKVQVHHLLSHGIKVGPPASKHCALHRPSYAYSLCPASVIEDAELLNEISKAPVGSMAKINLFVRFVEPPL